MWYGENLSAGSTSKGSVALSGKVTFTGSSSGSELSIDFGANGITSLLTENGVSGTGSPTTAFGDGWFALGIDPTANPSANQTKWLPFFRLLGDVNGDGTVTGPVGTAGTDMYIVNAARGTSGTLLNADVNGDGTVNTTDLLEVNTAYNANSKNNTVGATAPTSFPQFQLFAGGAGSCNVAAISDAQVQALVPTALAAWKAAGLNSVELQELQQVQIHVSNLGSNILGYETPGVIWISSTAAGYGWSVNDASRTGIAAGRVDLLTVLEHEMGHVVGLADNSQAGDLMDVSLGLGERRRPTAGDVTLLPQNLRSQDSPSSGDILQQGIGALGGNQMTAISAISFLQSATVARIALWELLPTDSVSFPSPSYWSLNPELADAVLGSSLADSVFFEDSLTIAGRIADRAGVLNDLKFIGGLSNQEYPI